MHTNCESCQWFILWSRHSIFLSLHWPSVYNKVPWTELGGSIPTSSISFQPSGEIHGGTAVWAFHTTMLLSTGLGRGGLALSADGIRFCFAWQGASAHDPQWVEPNHTASTVPGLLNAAATAAAATFAWKYSSRSHCRNQSRVAAETVPLEGTTFAWRAGSFS